MTPTANGLEILHQAWLNDPITKTLKRILDDHEDKIVAMLASQSMSTNVTDQTIRHLTVQLNTVRTIKQLAYDTHTFVTRPK